MKKKEKLSEGTHHISTGENKRQVVTIQIIGGVKQSFTQHEHKTYSGQWQHKPKRSKRDLSAKNVK
jgi:hypothetical protein